MKISVRIDAERDLTIVTVSEAITHEDLQEFSRQRSHVKQTKYVLWDLKRGGLQELHIEALKSYLAANWQRMERRKGGHTIFLAQCDVENMLTKWYRHYANSMLKTPVTFHVCRTMSEVDTLLLSLTEKSKTGLAPNL